MAMIPEVCPKCKTLHYWDRELDLTEEEEGVIKMRWECYNFECDYKTKWFTFECRELKET